MATAGMEDVIAAQSAITSIDGRRGELRYRGYSVGELAERCTFEEVAYLLWHGELPDETEVAALRATIRRVRSERADLLNLLRDVPPVAHPLDVLRYVVSWDALRHPSALHNTREANVHKAIEFAAWFPTIVANVQRVRSGRGLMPPSPELDTAANFLFVLHGCEPDPQQVRTLDTSLVLHADHEMNASTFAARVTIATQSNLHASVASALGTLAGPRHGGASEGVISMLEEIAAPERAESWVLDRLRDKQRIMGFGHRVYRTVDPRSRVLRVMAEQVLRGTAREAWIEILDRIAVVMRHEKGLDPNVDLYAAVVNHALGIEPAFYTSIFACSRVAGWTAHAMEQLGGRMIRPVAEYIGPDSRSLSTVVPV